MKFTFVAIYLIFEATLMGGSYLMKGNFFPHGDKNLWTLEKKFKLNN